MHHCLRGDGRPWWKMNFLEKCLSGVRLGSLRPCKSQTWCSLSARTSFGGSGHLSPLNLWEFFYYVSVRWNGRQCIKISNMTNRTRNWGHRKIFEINRKYFRIFVKITFKKSSKMLPPLENWNEVPASQQTKLTEAVTDGPSHEVIHWQVGLKHTCTCNSKITNSNHQATGASISPKPMLHSPYFTFPLF